jgi:hypothetical protein
MRIDPQKHGWMTTPETRAVMAAPRRASHDKKIIERCHED